MATGTPLRPVSRVEQASTFPFEPSNCPSTRLSLTGEPPPEAPNQERPAAVAPEPSPETPTQTGATAGAPPSGGSGFGPRREDVFCPVLGALLQNGQLQPDGYGRIKFADAARAMASAGVSVPFRSALTGTSPMANRPENIWRNASSLSFDVFSLRGGLVALLAGKGDSGILSGGTFDEVKFTTFVSHSQDGRTMTIADFAEASRDNALRDGRRSANVWARANLAAIIIALGYDDANGRRHVDIQTLRDLYEHKTLHFPGARPPTTGLGGLCRVLREMARLTPRT